jgi:hypothetical protein
MVIKKTIILSNKTTKCDALAFARAAMLVCYNNNTHHSLSDSSLPSKQFKLLLRLYVSGHTISSRLVDHILIKLRAHSLIQII